MNIQQTRNAQNVIRQAIIITNHGVMKIENVVRLVNTAWTDANQPYPLPYGEYKRRAWLLADLTRMQQQLADQLRDLELAAGLPVDEETGADLREHSGNSIAAAHAEALAMVDAYLLATHTGFSVEACAAELEAEEGDYFAVLARLRSVMDDAQAEALELNELRDFRIDAPEPEQVARTASITARLQSHIIAPVFILLMLLIGGSFNADAAEPVEHWVCGGQQVSYDGKSLTVDGWRFTRPLEVVKKQPSVTRAVGFENTNRQIVMLITVEGTTIFAGDYYPEVACTK